MRKRIKFTQHRSEKFVRLSIARIGFRKNDWLHILVAEQNHVHKSMHSPVHCALSRRRSLVINIFSFSPIFSSRRIYLIVFDLRFQLTANPQEFHKETGRPRQQ